MSAHLSQLVRPRPLCIAEGLWGEVIPWQSWEEDDLSRVRQIPGVAQVSSLPLGRLLPDTDPCLLARRPGAARAEGPQGTEGLRCLKAG